MENREKKGDRGNFLMIDDRKKRIAFLESAPRNYPETVKIYSQTKFSKNFVT